MLKINDLHYAYGKIQALNGIDLELEKGEIHAVIGANGAGKSTLMNCIAGQLRPQSGEILLDGEKLPGAPHLVVSKGVVLVPEGRQIFHNLTVEENLLMGGYTVKDRAPGVRKAFEMFPRLEERRRQRAGTLSGGEQQMLAIARGLMSNPKILLLDEPSLGLAPLIVNDVMRIIQQINSEGVTVLLVEQNARKALSIARTASVMEQGRVVKTGPAADISKDESVISNYLGKSKSKKSSGEQIVP